MVDWDALNDVLNSGPEHLEINLVFFLNFLSLPNRHPIYQYHSIYLKSVVSVHVIHQHSPKHRIDHGLVPVLSRDLHRRGDGGAGDGAPGAHLATLQGVVPVVQQDVHHIHMAVEGCLVERMGGRVDLGGATGDLLPDARAVQAGVHAMERLQSAAPNGEVVQEAPHSTYRHGREDGRCDLFDVLLVSVLGPACKRPPLAVDVPVHPQPVPRGHIRRLIPMEGHRA
mmetsp:Transcript_28723/g.91667  ORF Transcript_28723/g.91667 Transcript_28723/m.91667 type:complete len:226 (+) Transcript_28723:873-1550(+)